VVEKETVAILKQNSGMAIPEETRQTAKAAFTNGSLYISLRDKLGPIFEDETFADLYSDLGQPAESQHGWHRMAVNSIGRSFQCASASW
jgi:hypothetical protein